MNTTQFIDQLRRLIARDELDRALRQLRQFPANTLQLDTAPHQSGRFAAIRKQIRAALLELLREMETQQTNFYIINHS